MHDVSSVATDCAVPSGPPESGREAMPVQSVPKRGQGSEKRAPKTARDVCLGWEYIISQQDVFTTFREPDGYSNLISATPIWDRKACKTVMVCLWSRPVMGEE